MLLVLAVIPALVLDLGAELEPEPDPTKKADPQLEIDQENDALKIFQRPGKTTKKFY